MKECCVAMDLVLSRARDGQREGMVRKLMLNMSTGTSTHPIVVMFRKAPRGDTSEFASATYAIVEYCPFCGKPVKKVPERSIRRGSKA